MKKTHPVVMLPTEKATEDKNILALLDGKLIIRRTSMQVFAKPQHLYILSDEDIKEGDWVYDPVFNKVYRYVKGAAIIIAHDESFTISGTNGLHGRFKKIIATTDKSLIEGIRWNKEFPLPQIPESFIQAYIKAYNEGKPITEVDLEYDHLGVEWGYTTKPKAIIGGLKLRPDNTVIIHRSVSHSKDDLFKAFTIGAKQISDDSIGCISNIENWYKDQSHIRAFNEWYDKHY